MVGILSFLIREKDINHVQVILFCGLHILLTLIEVLQVKPKQNT